MISDSRLRSDVLRLFPVVGRLSAAQQEEFFSRVGRADLEQGSAVCSEGQSCTHLPLVLSGSVRVFKLSESGREITLYRIEAGQSCVLTASCMIGGAPFPANAVIDDSVTALLVPLGQVQSWMQASGAWRDFMFSLVAERLAEVISVVEEVAFRRVDARIADYILHKADPDGRLARTHQTIAFDLGTSREVVTRILKDLECRGIVSLARGELQLRDRKGLESLNK